MSLRSSASLSLFGLSLIVLGLGCDMKPPSPGTPDYQALAMVKVPGGAVNSAGGNFLTTREILSLDTRLGTWALSASYNSATGGWLWNFDVSYDGTTFVDESGAVYDVTSVQDGSAIPGSTWVKVDATRIKTKGGRLYEFQGGRLAKVRWTSSQTPNLTFVEGTVYGERRTIAIRQCDGAQCADVYSLLYDSQARLYRVDDWAGRRALVSYDPGGLIASIRDGLDVARGWPGQRFVYAGTLLTELRDSEDHLIQVAYTAATVKRVTTVTQVGEENPLHRFSYHNESQFRTAYTDPLGYQTDFVWDDNRRIRAISVEGDVTAYEWTGRRITREVRPSGVETSRVYVDDDLVSVHRPTGNVVTYTYDADAVDRSDPRRRPLMEASDSLGLIERRTYDLAGRLSTIETPPDLVGNGIPNETITYTYHPDEMTESITDAFGVVVSFSDYGRHGHPSTVLLPYEEKVLEYDAVGNLVAGDDFAFDLGPGQGGVVRRAFDEARNVVSMTLVNQPFLLGPESVEELTIEYRRDRQPSRINRPHGGDTEFYYDALGRQTHRSEKVTMGGQTTWEIVAFEHDAAGRITARRRANGGEETWTFGPAGRLEAMTISEDGQLQGEAEYDYADGRLVSVWDSAYGPGSEIKEYDPTTGLLSRIVFPRGEAIEYEYDLRSRISARVLKHQDGTVLRRLDYEYDLADREKKILDDGVMLLERVVENGLLKKTKYANSIKMVYDYDPFSGDVVETRLRDYASGTLVAESSQERLYLDFCASDICVSTITQTYRGEGLSSPVSLEDYQIGIAHGWSDEVKDAGRRIVASSGDPTATDFGDRWFSFDPLSNLDRTQNRYEPLCGEQQSELAAIYNPERNRLLRLDWTQGCTGVAHTYAYDEAGFVIDRDGVPIDWDGAGRVVGIGTVASLEWDAQHRIVSRTIGGARSEWLFGGLVEADASFAPVALDLGEVRIALQTGESSLYRHKDFRGNVKLVTNDDGRVVQHYAYGAFGVIESYGSIDDPYGFAGGLSLNGLVLLGPRLLDQVAGRFLAPDPIFQTINQYAYALGNPVFLWDPTGREAARTEGTIGGFTAADLTVGSAVAAAVAEKIPTPAAQFAHYFFVAATLSFGYASANGGFSWEGDLLGPAPDGSQEAPAESSQARQTRVASPNADRRPVALPGYSYGGSARLSPGHPRWGRYYIEPGTFSGLNAVFGYGAFCAHVETAPRGLSAIPFFGGMLLVLLPGTFLLAARLRRNGAG